MSTTINRNGFVLWTGHSELDDDTPIVGIVTGLTRKSKNSKVPGLQTYILRSHLDPVSARKRKRFDGVCGTCPHYIGGSCYVNWGQAPQNIYSCYKRGGYTQYNPDKHDNLLRGRFVRFGSGGEFTALPHALVASLASLCGSWTGYTHTWLQRNLQPYNKPYSGYLMASCESIARAKLAESMG